MRVSRILIVGAALCAVIGGFAFASGAKEAPLGSEENPIVWAFVPSGETQRVATGAQDVATLLHEKTGLYFKTSVATEYAGVIEAMGSKPPTAHMASLATFAYVLAAEKGVAQAALVSVRFGLPTYNGQIIAGAKTGIKSIKDLRGHTFGRPDPLSTSGWIIPMLTMKAAGINTDTDLKQVVDAGSHDAVVAAVYNGDVDAGATYVDARATVQKNHPDVMEKVIVIGTTTDIPNDGVQFIPSMPSDMKDKIVNALLEISKSDAGKKALHVAYQWDGLQKIDDHFYDPFRQVLQASGMKIEDLNK